MSQNVKIATLLFLLSLGSAQAGALVDDGGCPGGSCSEDGGVDGGTDAGVPLACDGGLCDTTYGSGCSAVASPVDFAWLGVALTVVSLSILRRRAARRAATFTAFALAAVFSTASWAEPPPEVDVAIRDEPPPRRVLAIEYSPLPFLIGKLSANVIITPISHHAIVISPSYVSVETAPIYVFDDTGQATQLPKQKFSGFGGELGYRYYLGERGPRGFFFGPSLMLSSLIAQAQDNSKTRFLHYGIAADLGYQALLWDSVALSIGGGVQYTRTDKAIPDQQFPAKFFANGGVRPRFLLSVGWAF